MLDSKLSQALSDISDDKIAAAAEIALCHRRRIWPRVVAAAAVLLLLLGSILFAPWRQSGGGNVMMPTIPEVPNDKGNQRTYFALYAYTNETESVEMTQMKNSVVVSRLSAESTMRQDEWWHSAPPLPEDPNRPDTFRIVVYPPDNYAVDSSAFGLPMAYVTFMCEGKEIEGVKGVLSWGKEEEYLLTWVSPGKGLLGGRGFSGYTLEEKVYDILIHNKEGELLQKYQLKISPKQEGGYEIRLIDIYMADEENIVIRG